MIYIKALKRVTFGWNNEKKTPLTIRINNGYEETEATNLVHLTKSETGSLQRFIFSMIQFHAHPKKKKTLESNYDKMAEDNDDPDATIMQKVL